MATSIRRLGTVTNALSTIVIGSGAAGTAAVGNLLEHGAGDILWVDPSHAAGKISSQWDEVPSNTDVKLFLQYARYTKPFRQIIDSTPKPNAITALEKLDQNNTCQLSYASEMIWMLGDGLRKMDRVKPVSGKAIGANLESQSSSWTLEHISEGIETPETSTAPSIVLAAGASPSVPQIPVDDQGLQRLGLETVLRPSELRRCIPRTLPTTIAVIGGSHSAVLALMNLTDLATTSHPLIRIRWFTRNKLLYAEKKDGWILYDNTGLKGSAATFAQEHLEDDKLRWSYVGRVLKKIDCSGGESAEKAAYTVNFPDCTHVVYATGFRSDPLPVLTKDGIPFKNPRFDHDSGRFWQDQSQTIPGLFGAGIAFPERVTDRAGNVELAVGCLKFQRFLSRVVPQWLTT